MATRLLFQLFFFLLPFVAYGVFRYSTRRVRDWKRSWPMLALFVASLVLGGVAWVISILLQPDKERNVCHEAARYENGVLIPARSFPCEKDVSRSGSPRAVGGE
jgi:hypothetical protein